MPFSRQEYYRKNKARITRSNKKWAAANVEKMRKYRREWNRRNQGKYRARVRKIVIKMKSVPCMDCGEKYPYYVMDFDHVRGKKIFNLGSTGNFLSPKKVIKEAAKCDVVCANCHRIRTHKRNRKL